MFSCVNYDRGCRGRSNTNNTRCLDCITLGLSAGRSNSASPKPATSSGYSAMSGAFASLAPTQLKQSWSLSETLFRPPSLRERHSLFTIYEITNHIINHDSAWCREFWFWSFQSENVHYHCIYWMGSEKLKHWSLLVYYYCAFPFPKKLGWHMCIIRLNEDSSDAYQTLFGSQLCSNPTYNLITTHIHVTLLSQIDFHRNPRSPVCIRNLH